MDPHMQMTSTQEMERLIAFTRKAAEVLRDNNNLVTFTDGDIEPARIEQERAIGQDIDRIALRCPNHDGGSLRPLKPLDGIDRRPHDQPGLRIDLR